MTFLEIHAFQSNKVFWILGRAFVQQLLLRMS